MAIQVMCNKCWHERFCPDINIHPWEVLRDCLDADNIKQKDFAEKIKTSTKHLNRILKGKANITTWFAYKLEWELGMSAEFRLNMQNSYDLFKLRNKND